MSKVCPSALLALDGGCEGPVHALFSLPTLTPSMVSVVLENNPYITKNLDGRGMTPLMVLCGNENVSDKYGCIKAWIHTITATVLQSDDLMSAKCRQHQPWLAAEHAALLRNTFGR